MNLTRRQLLRNTAVFGGTVLFSRGLMGCAVDASDARTGDGEEGEENVEQTADDLVTCRPPTISANHGHTLVVSAADVAANVGKTYSIKGTSAHDHLVTITPAQFTTLGTGRPITVTSTNVAGHTHTVTVACSVTPPPTASCSRGAAGTSITANHGHSLTVPRADVAAGAAKTYSIKGTSAHPHQVTITAAQFVQLKNGQRLDVTSTSVQSHTHIVKVACA